MICRWLLRVEEWFDKIMGVPTRSDVDAARQEWLAASRDLDAAIEKALCREHRNKVH